MFDFSLYLVTDRVLSRGRTTVDIVRAAVAGGVTCVQLREKSLSTRDFIAEARLLKGLFAPMGIPLIINDRLDVAWPSVPTGSISGSKIWILLMPEDLPVQDWRSASR